MNYMHNIWKLYAIKFFHNLIPAYVIERLFWEQRGMPIQMVIYTEIIYALTIVLLEIPTGIIADKWGRKKMIVMNAFFGCCEFIILVFATKFQHFAAAVILAGVGSSACSGSEHALLYDSLLSNNKEHDFEKCLGRLNAYDFTAVILAALSGSLLAGRFGFELNYWLSFTAMLISLCISIMLVETDIKSKDEEPIKFSEYATASVNFFKFNPDVCLVLFSGMVTGAALNYIDEFWSLYIDRLGIPVIYFGLVSAVLAFVRLPGNVIAYSLKNRYSYRTMITVVIFVLTGGLLYLSAVKGFSSLIVIFLICAVSGIIEPLTAGYLHHRIDSSMRATIDSFQSLGLRVVTMVIGFGFGFFSARFDIFEDMVLFLYFAVYFLCFI